MKDNLGKGNTNDAEHIDSVQLQFCWAQLAATAVEKNAAILTDWLVAQGTACNPLPVHRKIRNQYCRYTSPCTSCHRMGIRMEVLPS